VTVSAATHHVMQLLLVKSQLASSCSVRESSASEVVHLGSHGRLSVRVWLRSGAIEMAERDNAVMRVHAPGRAEFWPRGRDDEERRGPTALGQSLHKIERGRIGPMQVLEREHNRLRSRFSEQPRGQRRQLPAPQLLRRELFRQRDVHQRRDQGHVFGSVETDQPQRVLQIGKASSGWLIRAETLPLFLARFRPHPSPMTNPAPGAVAAVAIASAYEVGTYSERRRGNPQ
jgi:hypothetical protein